MNENLFELVKFDKHGLLQQLQDAEYMDSLHDPS